MLKSFFTLLATSALLVACTEVKVEQIASPTNPYPGNPDENFAPTLVRDGSYKNLALNRMAYASSSWDYSLTAQLATDGMVADKQPAHIVLSTKDGLVPKNQREWMFDLKTNTGNKLEGTDNYFQLDFNNFNLDFDKIQVVGRVTPKKKEETYFGVPGQEAGAIDPKKIMAQFQEVNWTISLQGSTDGTTWTDLDSATGKGMRIFQSLSKQGEFSHYRLNLSAPEADTWNISDWDFLKDGVELKLTVGNMTEVYDRSDVLPLRPDFSSVWMSEGKDEEWIYVDLGVKASIDQVKLHWISQNPTGKLQVSNDKETWKDVADIADEISVSEKARYVRLALQSGGPYILSEFEVFGKDGVMVQPKAQKAATEGRMDLAGGNWKLQRANLVEADGAALSSENFDDSQWIVATVPATVLSSYINVGAIPDPNYSDNQLQLSESFFLSDFWYRDTFTVPESFQGKNVFLNFDGINWKAEVYLNGQNVGRVEGAFTRGLFNIGKYLKEGTNTLAVKIIKNAFPGTVKEQTAESTDSNGGTIGADDPTFHATVGWDWIPTIRGRNIGIWNDVYLTAIGDVKVSDPFVRTELNLPDTTVATVFVEATLQNISDKPVDGVLKGAFGETAFSKNVQLAAGEEQLVKVDSFQIKNPKLWWPAGYGSPVLYDTKVAFEANGKVTDEVAFKSGVRQMTFAIDEVGALNLYVNGRRFIGRGGNWGFAESNLTYRAREYDIAVKYHADMNFTMIRNWVGQVGDDEFYEACDRHGVMIWQDFWLANPWDGPDPYNESLFMANATDYVKRIRNHASIGLYCGRNEGMPTPTLDEALRNLVKEQHPGLHYISHSAAAEVSGGGPYRALPVEQYFDLKGADRFHSERGMPNVMNYESMAKMLPTDKLWPQNSLWGMHDFTLQSAQYGTTFNELVQNGFGGVNDIQTFTKYAQWINYNGYRAMFEGRGKNRQGLLLWMSHSCWPSMVWQTYDYFFEPTAAYFGCKKASEPLHVQFNPLTNKVEVVNMNGRDRKSLNVIAQIFDLAGKMVWEQKSTISSKEDSTVECMPVEVPADITEVYFIRLKLSEGEKLVSENFYWEGRENGNYQAIRKLATPKLDVKTSFQKGETCKGTATVTNNSDVPALVLRAKLVDTKGELILPVIYSDNYFSLMPGESKEITVEFSSFDLAGREPKLVVE